MRRRDFHIHARALHMYQLRNDVKRKNCWFCLHVLLFLSSSTVKSRSGRDRDAVHSSRTARRSRPRHREIDELAPLPGGNVLAHRLYSFCSWDLAMTSMASRMVSRMALPMP